MKAYPHIQTYLHPSFRSPFFHHPIEKYRFTVASSFLAVSHASEPQHLGKPPGEEVGFLVVQGISSPTFGLLLVQGEGPESRQVPCSHVIFLGSVMALHKRLDIMFYFGAFPPFIRWMSSFSMCFYLWTILEAWFTSIFSTFSSHLHSIPMPFYFPPSLRSLTVWG